MRPFSEAARFEQGQFDDEFFATGSLASFGDEPRSFSRSLSGKEQIRLTFDVTKKIMMLPNSCSIYYFNHTDGNWNVPTGSLSDHVGPFDKIALKTTAAHFGGNFTMGSVIFEDKIGFDAYGNCVASGSLTLQRQSSSSFCQSMEALDGQPTFSVSQQQVAVLSGDYPKSCQRNSSYDATDDEVFSLPIDQPFLLEKAVIELPLSFGPGWFLDKTIANWVTSSGGDYQYAGAASGDLFFAFDDGGPAITLSLFTQKVFGRSKIRDLIAKTTFTHTYDSSTLRYMTIFSGTANQSWSISPDGSDLNDNIEARIAPVLVGGKPFLTGTLQFKMTPRISNGVKALTVVEDRPGNYGGNNALFFAAVEAYIRSKYVKNPSCALMSIDPFGRGMTGFAPSGGSIFGKEYVTTQDVLRKDGTIPNPHYLSSSSAVTAFMSSFTSSYVSTSYSLNDTTFFVGPVFYGTKTDSPYLIRPGEKLIIALAKTRPAYKNFKSNVANATDANIGRGQLISGSFWNDLGGLPGHDVCLSTGSINITLYGSYVQGNKEYR